MSEQINEGAAGLPGVLVVGATGYLGSHILAQVRQAGYPVRALVRDPNRLGTERAHGVDVFVGQATRPETLEGLCDGISVVVSALGVRSLARRPTPWDVDYQGNLNVLTCAQRAGVKHFIFVGVLHGAAARADLPVLEPRERFIDVLRQSGLTWTILRPTGAFNDMAMIFRQARHGRAYLLGSGETRINPIHGADLASEVVRCIEDAGAYNRTYDVGGPDTFTYAEIAQVAFQALGTQPHITHITPRLVDGLSQVLKPFNLTGAGFLRFFRWVMTADMVAVPIGQIHLGDFFRQLASQSKLPRNGQAKR